MSDASLASLLGFSVICHVECEPHPLSQVSRLTLIQQQLANHLHQLLSIAAGTAGPSTTTDQLKKVTTELQSIYKNQLVVPPLVEIALSSGDEQVRQLGACLTPLPS